MGTVAIVAWQGHVLVQSHNQMGLFDSISTLASYSDTETVLDWVSAIIEIKHHYIPRFT